MITHPPCTHLSASGLHWNKKDKTRQAKTDLALYFVRLLMSANIDKICIENLISFQIRKPEQIIQPYQFGHNASKKHACG